MGFTLGLIAATTILTPQTLERFTFSQVHMGMEARLVVYAPSSELAERVCTAAFARIGELDAIMSDYRRDSELNRLCDQAGGEPVVVSDDLLKVLARSLEISRATGGAFDITVGPIVQLWRTARRTAQLPTQAEIDAARAKVGYAKMTLDPIGKRVRLRTPGMRLDLGGIAKGYACDAAQDVLRKHGITRALVEMGGDIVLSDAPPATKGWQIRIMTERGPEDRSFANCAISTSGDTEQFVIVGGKRYSHVVDPRTGWAVTNRVQATVVARDGFTSDPLSKIFALVDRKTATTVLKRFGVTEWFVRVAKLE